MKTRESERKMRKGCKKLVCALLSCTMLCACTSTKSVEKQSNKKQYVKTDQFTSALIDSTDYKGKWIKIEGKVKLGPEVSGNMYRHSAVTSSLKLIKILDTNQEIMSKWKGKSAKIPI